MRSWLEFLALRTTSDSAGSGWAQVGGRGLVTPLVCGRWLLVWLLIWALGQRHCQWAKSVLTVDDKGGVHADHDE